MLQLFFFCKYQVTYFLQGLKVCAIVVAPQTEGSETAPENSRLSIVFQLLD